MGDRRDMNNKVNDIYQFNKKLQIIIIIILNTTMYISHYTIYTYTYVWYMCIYVLCKYTYISIYKNASVSDSVKWI